ncbi:Serine/threonine-protein phosphatase [Lachancea thermotolerans]|uniref:Serine/threonine-protein phosphatase n=1 Tax=Lachancea thermotolerans (strain ATCC 56472 / CBS 6340 / NRRL Y-8284) TaxID=559295 RepID=C5DC04_LACTC|nr:KLTH0A06798p [Lachancea thermotolerans CBS 6340]CAR21311.1 KLTH0A06798p [Lachancea thermotolerans CBS 6340]
MELDRCLERLYAGELLPEATIRALCFKLKEKLVRESNVVHISTPVTVVGDIHGQFHDLLEIFHIGGAAPDTNYLFLGDYVDRGLYSVETWTLLMVLKLRWPSRIQLLRGNHESRQITQSYGFYTECVNKYGGSSDVWRQFTDVFDYLALCCVVDDELFCVHGGLSPNVQTVDQIRVIDRFREIPHDGAMADLVWSDPEETGGQDARDGRTTGLESSSPHFQVSPRGAGYTFGRSVVEKFLQLNGMSKIYRAHQLCNEGYQVYFGGLVTTVWSAPNYCYRCGNKASILELYDKDNGYFNVFEEAPENKLLHHASTSGQITNNNAFLNEFFDERGGDVFSDEYQAASASRRHVEYFL